MSEWVYFLHAPRESFAATMSGDERALWAQHSRWVDRLFDHGLIVLVGVRGRAA